jgi:hypothetical protein
VTVALGLLLFGALMLYCGVKGKSLRHALTGRSVDKAQGPLISNTVTGSSTPVKGTTPAASTTSGASVTATTTGTPR